MTFHGKNFVAEKLSAGSGHGFRVTSPITNAPLDGEFFTADETDVDAAMNAAETAFASFRETTPEQRAKFLETIAEEILALGEGLIERAHLETALPRERITGERARTIGQLKLFAQAARESSWVEARIDTALPDRQPLPKPDVRRMMIPLGPVIVFGASNFPLAYSVAGGDTASALATGNPVVVKAHEAHPGTSELVATAIRKAVEKCALPAGVFSLLHGDGRVVGVALARHPISRAIGFTGSRTGGRALFDAAAARPEPIPVFAEMSSLNPLFVLPGALRERGAQLAEGVRQSVTLGVGQFCTKPGLIFGVGGSDFSDFRDAIGLAFASAPAGTMLHAGICEAFYKNLAKASSVPGVDLVSACCRREGQQPPDPAVTQAGPILLGASARDFLSHPELAEEVFGPFALLITAQSMDELMEAARSLEGQLTATIHGTPGDLAQAAPLVKLLERKAGRLIINGYPTGLEVCPAMQHGGPWPATTDARFTSVGTAALQRFVRPVCYQNFPPDLLPEELRDENPRRIWRLVNGGLTQDGLAP